MDQQSIQQFRDNVASTKADRSRVRSLIATGRWRDAEPDKDRFKRFSVRANDRIRVSKRESIQGDTLDYQPASFLSEGAAVRRSIAFVEVSVGTSSAIGSGFLISPRLFLTNQHVIGNAQAALGAVITFDRELDEQGRQRKTTSYALDPESFALFSDEAEFDFALIAVGERQSGDAALSELGFCCISDAQDKHVIGMSANIIQHPNGARKVISIRNNHLVARTSKTLLYETDTDNGSSGAPVFNDDWEVVALHHYGEPSVLGTDGQDRVIPVNVNEGIRASALFGEFNRALPSLPQSFQPFLTEALDFGAISARTSVGPTLGPPQRTRPRESFKFSALPQPLKGNPMTTNVPAQTIEMVIPLKVLISLDNSFASQQGAAAEPSNPLFLKRKSEAIKIDVDYKNRKGFITDFLPGVNVELPILSAGIKSSLAPLRASEPDANEGELKYQHFSIKMHRSKKMAIFTATNIDGVEYLIVDRKTNEVSSPAESERWFEDPRISSSFFLDQSFYSEWSTFFDRGHLTRRTDPTWGNEEDALRANADTFHFTNCSPQHFRFNQTANYWQGLERYVLEKGAIAAGSKNRLCVFQGPIFDDDIDRMAGDIQIPSAFFKVVIWIGPSGLKAVGLVADQGALLDESRRALGKPTDVPFVNVNHWRVAITAIEKRCGLDFGAKVRNADTIAQQPQPTVGREALQGLRITDLTEILL
jgi:endonuclease G, mitochondrial